MFDQHAINALVARVASQNTIVVTFTDRKALAFALNWARHLQGVAVKGVLVGLMGMPRRTPLFAATERRLGMYGATVYPLPASASSQGGRWFNVMPLLLTGKRVLVSDADVVWLRDPRPYLRALEAAHPRMDFAVSTDGEWATDGRRLAGAPEELDVEGFSACSSSMNIGILSFAPGGRPGTRRAIAEVMAHLSLPGNMRRVDQGPINYRWKRGADGWRWRRTLHAVRDTARGGAASGGAASGRGGGKPRLCGLVNGSVVAGVLPIAQFGNMLTHGVLNLSAPHQVQPIAVHATWLRSQHPTLKVWRLREYGFWFDERGWYEGRYLSYTPRVPPALLHAPFSLARHDDGTTELPTAHLRLMHAQLSEFRNALFLARLLHRALILPPLLCGCEFGFHPRHVQRDCRAHQHTTLPIPYVCAIDHYLDPQAIERSSFALRERSFLANRRTPAAIRDDVVHVLSADGTELRRDFHGRDATSTSSSLRRAASVRLPRVRPMSTALRTALAPHQHARRLHIDDVLSAFGGFDGAENASLVPSHDDAQAILSSWCCTSQLAFRQTRGLVPYVLPPLEGQRQWRGGERRWVASALRTYTGTS